MQLPGLLIDANLTQVLATCSKIAESREQSIELDASRVHAIEPVALSLLAACGRHRKRHHKSLSIKGLPSKWHDVIGKLCPDIQLRRLGRSTRDALVPRTDAVMVQSSRDSNTAANELASRISQFVPREDQETLLADQFGLRIYNAIQPALAYILVELVDNVFNHARTEEFRDPVAWMVVQYYRRGDLVRIAVVDDGCGVFGSMRGMPNNPPHNHFDAIEQAFRPFVSSKNIPTIYAERRHMGIGLPVCRDLCRRMDGQVYAASGDAWVANPGLETENRKRADPFFQGTIVSLEFHRRAATVNSLKEILSTYSGSVDLPINFHND